MSSVLELPLFNVFNKVGTEFGNVNRKLLLSIQFFLMFICWVLFMTALYGHAGNTVREVAWVQIDMATGDAWANLWGMCMKAKGKTVTECAKWSSASDLSNQLDWDGACEDCKDASQASTGLLVMTILVISVKIVLVIFMSRCDIKKDVGQKFINVITCILALLFSLASIAEFGAQCIQKMENLGGVGAKLGHGSNCVIAGLVLFVPVLLLELAIPGFTKKNQPARTVTGAIDTSVIITTPPPSPPNEEAGDEKVEAGAATAEASNSSTLEAGIAGPDAVAIQVELEGEEK